jgi:hypothetical protein
MESAKVDVVVRTVLLFREVNEASRDPCFFSAHAPF